MLDYSQYKEYCARSMVWKEKSHSDSPPTESGASRIGESCAEAATRAVTTASSAGSHGPRFCRSRLPASSQHALANIRMARGRLIRVDVVSAHRLLFHLYQQQRLFLITYLYSYESQKHSFTTNTSRTYNKLDISMNFILVIERESGFVKSIRKCTRIKLNGVKSCDADC